MVGALQDFQSKADPPLVGNLRRLSVILDEYLGEIKKDAIDVNQIHVKTKFRIVTGALYCDLILTQVQPIWVQVVDH